MISHGYGPGGSGGDLSGNNFLTSLRVKKTRGRRRRVGNKILVPLIAVG